MIDTIKKLKDIEKRLTIVSVQTQNPNYDEQFKARINKAHLLIKEAKNEIVEAEYYLIQQLPESEKRKIEW